MASSRSNEELSDLLVKAALNDPAIAVPGFEASRVPAGPSDGPPKLTADDYPGLFVTYTLGRNPHWTTSHHLKIFALVSVLLSSPSSPKKKLVAQMKTVYQFKIENADGVKAVWVVDMKKRGRVQVVPQSEKPSAKPDVTIEMNDRDCVGLATGTRIKVRGNLDRALLVEKIITHERQKIESYADPRKRSSDTGRWTGVGKAKL